MKSKLLRTILVILFTVGLLCLLSFLIAPFPFSYWTKPVDAPGYVSSVWPPPGTSIWRGYYDIFLKINSPAQQGIGVTIKTWDLAEVEMPSANNANELPFVDRVYLYVDGSQVPNSQRAVWDNGAMLLGRVNGQVIEYDLSTEYSMSWAQSLLPGEHSAKLVINARSGDILEYEWSFRIK